MKSGCGTGTAKWDGRVDLGAFWPSRDHQYSYDGLDRLIMNQRGIWTGGTLTPSPGGEKWSLDSLGNWTKYVKDLDGDGISASSTTNDHVDDRSHNFSNELTTHDATEPVGGTPTTVTLPLSYDAAGNMSTQDLSGTLQRKYIHDAWNRLVKVEHIDNPGGTPSSPYPVAVYEYNGLHWRTVRAFDPRPAITSPCDLLQRRAIYYDASWRAIHEEMQDDTASPPSGGETPDANGCWAPQSPTLCDHQFWGNRYIDDAVMRRRAAITAAGSNTTPPTVTWDTSELNKGWYQLTDAQFCVVAVVDEDGVLKERVVYDAYGKATRHDAGDYNGDTIVDTQDIFDFLNDWFGSSLNANVDRQGGLAPADVSMFVTGPMWFGAQSAPAGAISAAGGVDNAIGYCGYQFNRETQEYSVRCRHFTPLLGKWSERNRAGYVDGASLYDTFVSSPINTSDPLGLCSQPGMARTARWLDSIVLG